MEVGRAAASPWPHLRSLGNAGRIHSALALRPEAGTR